MIQIGNEGVTLFLMGINAPRGQHDRIYLPVIISKLYMGMPEWLI